MPAPLRKFEGRNVRKARLIVTKTGDGLSDSLDVDPLAFKVGEEIGFLVTGTVQKVRYDPASPTSEDLVRVHIVPATRVAIVSADDIRGQLEAEADRVLRLQEEAAGVQRLEPLETPEAVVDVDPLSEHFGDN